MGEIAKKFHTHSIIWTRYPVQSFKTIASKKCPCMKFLHLPQRRKMTKFHFWKNPFFPIIRAGMDEIAKTFHTYSVIWTRYPVQSFKIIASKKMPIRNSYIYLNTEKVEKMTKSHFWKNPFSPIIQVRIDEITKNFHTYSVIWTRYPVQSFKIIASKKVPM